MSVHLSCKVRNKKAADEINRFKKFNREI